MTKISPEQRISHALRPLLDSASEGGDFVESTGLRDVLVGLEFFLPQILAEVYPYWEGESLDGFYLTEARKIGPASAELRGVCILISDQTITPFHLLMRIAPSTDEINWMECRLGKRGDGKGNMERLPCSQWPGRLYQLLGDSTKQIDWTYKIAFGDEQNST